MSYLQGMSVAKAKMLLVTNTVIMSKNQIYEDRRLLKNTQLPCILLKTNDAAASEGQCKLIRLQRLAIVTL